MDDFAELKKRREAVNKEIADLSIEKEKNAEKIIELLNELEKLDSQIAELEKKSEKQKGRFSLSTVVFRSLQSVLSRSNEFYPNNELFDEDLVYFPEKELHAMRAIQVCLTNDTGERMFLLYGDPASGKTVMGIAVGKALEKKGYESLYYKLTDKSDINALWPDIHRYGENDVLFILDDCHLNIETVNLIYTRFENIPHAACLLISRALPKNLRVTDEYLPDIFKKLEDRCYKMDVAKDKQVEDKMSGIILKRKAFYERTKKKEFVVGDLQRVMKNVLRNYLTLYFYLSFWTDSQPLDQLDESKVLQKVYSRYLDIKANKLHRDIFLKYAALYRYEIQFRPAPGDEGSVEALSGQGFLEYDSEIELYRFYHSDFAKLLLKSYSSRSIFTERYTNLEEFTTTQLKAYITGFNTYPPNLSELYNNLVMNAGIAVFGALLKDAEVRNKTIALYKNIDPLYHLSNFLSQVEHYANDEFETFIKELIVSNPSIKNLFLSGKETFPPFCQILIMLKNNHPGYYSTFLGMFNHDERKLILLSTSPHIMGQYLNALSNSDMSTAKFLLNTVTVNELLKESYQLEFHNLGNALNGLKNIDREKIEDVFANIDLSYLVGSAKKVDFHKLGNALSDFMNVNPRKAKKIFAAINIDLLATRTRKVSFERVRNTLNELESVNPRKAKKIFAAINIDLLAASAQEVSFERLGKVLSDLNNVNPGKAKDIFAAINIDHLLARAQEVSFGQFGKVLRDLNNVNPGKAKEIFTAINIDHLLARAQEVSFGQFGKVLRDLNNVNPGKAKEIFAAISIDHLAARAQEVSFGQFGKALSELNNVNPGKAKEIFDAIKIDHLAAKAQEVSFNNLGRALNELKTIDAGKAKKIFGQTEPGFLLDKAQQVDFKRFGNALCNLEKVDIEKCGEILRNINLRTLVQKAQQEKYNVFLNNIPAVARIDAAATKQLLTGLPEEFLFQFDFLLNSQNFNRLLYTIHLSGHTEYAMKLIDFAKENLDTFMKNPLNDIAYFFSLCSEYIDVKPIISEYSSKFFGKMKYGEPLHIAFFLRVIHGIDRNTALEYLHYLEKIGLKEPLGSCYYQIGKSLAEKEEITGSINYLKKALPLLEEYENKNCLALTYFLLAKNEEALNHREKARTSANKALLNAGELPGLEKEIEDFLIQINKN